MIERTTGLILRVHPLTETSLIVHWLTRDMGRVGTVAKGARRPKSPFRGKLDLYYLADLTYYSGRGADLHILREVEVIDLHEGLRRDVGCLQQAAYGARLIEQATETESPLPAIYELMTGWVKELSEHPPRLVAVFGFEVKLLNELGLKPDFGKAALSSGAKELLERMVGLDWPELFRLGLSHAQTAEIRDFLHGFLLYHLGRIAPGRAEALKAGLG